MTSHFFFQDCMSWICTSIFNRSRPNWITGLGPKSGSAGKWCRYLTENCLLDSHLPFVYIVILYISPIRRIGETNPSTKTSKILFSIVMPTFGKTCQRPWLLLRIMSSWWMLPWISVHQLMDWYSWIHQQMDNHLLIDSHSRLHQLMDSLLRLHQLMDSHSRLHQLMDSHSRLHQLMDSHSRLHQLMDSHSRLHQLMDSHSRHHQLMTPWVAVHQLMTPWIAVKQMLTWLQLWHRQMSTHTKVPRRPQRGL